METTESKNKRKHIMDRNAYKKINDNPIILDFTGCKYLGEIHKVLKERFGFPDYYGENLDALWDCLRYYCKDRRYVYIKGTDTLPEELKGYMTKVMEIFDDVHEETPNITFEVID